MYISDCPPETQQKNNLLLQNALDASFPLDVEKAGLFVQQTAVQTKVKKPRKPTGPRPYKGKELKNDLKMIRDLFFGKWGNCWDWGYWTTYEKNGKVKSHYRHANTKEEMKDYWQGNKKYYKTPSLTQIYYHFFKEDKNSKLCMSFNSQGNISLIYPENDCHENEGHLPEHLPLADKIVRRIFKGAYEHKSTRGTNFYCFFVNYNPSQLEEIRILFEDIQNLINEVFTLKGIKIAFELKGKPTVCIGTGKKMEVKPSMSGDLFKTPLNSHKQNYKQELDKLSQALKTDMNWMKSLKSTVQRWVLLLRSRDCSTTYKLTPYGQVSNLNYTKLVKGDTLEQIISKLDYTNLKNVTNSLVRDTKALDPLFRFDHNVSVESAIEYLRLCKFESDDSYYDDSSRIQRTEDILKYLRKEHNPKAGKWIYKDFTLFVEKHFPKGVKRQVPSRKVNISPEWIKAYLAVLDIVMIQAPNSNGEIPRANWHKVWNMVVPENIKWCNFKWLAMNNVAEEYGIAKYDHASQPQYKGVKSYCFCPSTNYPEPVEFKTPTNWGIIPKTPKPLSEDQYQLFEELYA